MIVEGDKMNISQFNQIHRTAENISDPVIKAIVKYKAHPSVIAIKETCTSKSNFNFWFAEKVDILKEIKMLQSNKATQNTDIPTKLIKGNADILQNLFLPASISALNSLFSDRN